MSEIKQQQPDKDFEVIFNIDGVEYYYNFNVMSMDRIFQAEKFFTIEMESNQQLPQLPEEVTVAANRQITRQAYAALLIKKDKNGYEPYNPAKVSSFDVLSQITGKDYKRLQECREDFFINTGLQSKELMMQSRDIIRQLSEVDGEKLMPLLATAAQMSGGSSMLQNFASNFTQTDTSGSDSESQAKEQ